MIAWQVPHYQGPSAERRSIPCLGKPRLGTRLLAFPLELGAGDAEDQESGTAPKQACWGLPRVRGAGEGAPAGCLGSRVGKAGPEAGRGGEYEMAMRF